MNMDNNVFDSWLTKQPVAHRGLHDDAAPENSIAAFEKAIARGFAIETDVQVTKDGVPLIFHDDLLDRMTNGQGDVREKTFNEICDLTLNGSEEKIPLFTEFLRFVDGRVPLLIEIKDHKNIGEAEKIIYNYLAEYKGKYAVQSFNPFIIKWFKQNTTCTAGVLSSSFDKVPLAFWKKIVLKKLWMLKNCKADFVSYEQHGGQKLKKLKKLKGNLPILFWTIRSEQEAQEAKKICDNIIFENFIPQ